MIKNNNIKILIFQIILFFSNYSFSQCLEIKNLIDISESESEILSNFNYSVNERLNAIEYKGQLINVTNFTSYTGTDNSNKIISDFNGYLEFKTYSNSCFMAIKLQVVKEIGRKVHPKQVSVYNSWEIESYEHMNKDIFIQFHKSSENYGFKIVIISKNKLDFFQIQIYKIEQQQAADKNIENKLTIAREFLTQKKYDEAEREIQILKSLLDYQLCSKKTIDQIDSFEEELQISRFQDFRSEIYGLLNLNKYLTAKNKISELKKRNFYNSNFDNIESEINKKAVSFFSEKATYFKDKREYQKSMFYSDSVLIFSNSDRAAFKNKSEMMSIIDFLNERKYKTFDYWQSNNSLKNQLINDYKEKSFSLISNQSNGEISFNLVVLTDTNCFISTKIEWNSKVNENIIFESNEIQKYNILPFENYGYCSKSKGVIPFNLSWTNNYYKFKFISGEIKSSQVPDKKVTNYLSLNYPSINGKIKYIKNNVVFNDEKESVLLINSFKTRGPLNSIYSLIVPGLGTKRVTYGKKGLGIFLCFAGGVASVFSGNQQAAQIGAGVIAATYIWDFTSTLVKGSKNLIRSKDLRRQLRKEPIRLI
jgi:hypothetical protein